MASSDRVGGWDRLHAEEGHENVMSHRQVDE